MISDSLFLYLLFEMISLLLFHFSIKLKQRNKTLSKLFLLFSALPFIFLVCFRAKTVGTDYGIYNWAYNIVLKNDSYAHEWLGLFFYVFKLLSVTRSYQISLAIINSVIIILFYISAYKSKESSTLVLATIFAFCLHLQVFNQFRQSLALAICLLNIENAREQKTKRFIALQILATIAHTTSIIFLPTLFLAKIKFNKKMLLIYTLFSFAAYIFGSSLLRFLSFTSYGQRYLGGRFDYVSESSNTLLIIRILLFAIVLIVGAIIGKQQIKTNREKKKENDNTHPLYHMAAICTIIQIVATKSYIFARLTTYYYLAYVILIPELIARLKMKKKQKTAIMLVVLLLLLLYKVIYYQTMGPGAGIDNYHFIWDEY